MANVSASANASWDNHTEFTKNALDTEHSVGVEAAKSKIVMCSKHVGCWVSRPKSGLIKNSAEVRDCPLCLTEHATGVQQQADATPPPVQQTSEELAMLERKMELDMKMRNLELEHEAKKRELDARLPKAEIVVQQNPIRQQQPQQYQQQPQQQYQQQPQQYQQQVQQYQQSSQPMMAGTVIYSNAPIAFTIDRNRGYSTEWYDLAKDPNACCMSFCVCCIPFAICDIADKIDDPTHNAGGVFTAILASVCYPCGILCCIDKMALCFLTSLLKNSMKAHGIGKAPSPCGETECLCCWWQIICCWPCTLALMLRETRRNPVVKGKR